LPAGAKLRAYVNIFDEMGADWEAIVDHRDSEKEACFVEDVVSKRGLLLDLCCGTCRHSIILHQDGVAVIGMDISRNLLRIARRRMKESGVAFPLVRAEMRRFPFRNNVFGSVISMFTSFGYLPSEAEDVKSFREISRTLANGGFFLLDVANLEHIKRNFRERDWGEFEPYYMLEDRTLKLANPKLMSNWTLIRKETCQIESIVHEVRLYALDRLRRLLKKSKLAIRRLYGGYNKQRFGPKTSRMIIIAQKR
jgi:SAM-dependent methyltransferase